MEIMEINVKKLVRIALALVIAVALAIWVTVQGADAIVTTEK